MRFSIKGLLAFLATFVALLLLHLPLLRLPYHWDEAGYYIPAALDFYRSWLLIPITTLPEGHPPLVMIYLGLAWRLFGYSPWTTRAAMTLVAAATVTSLYALGRRVGSREVAAWSALLLALSPLFFAQSTLAHLDLTAALFTTLAVLFLLGDQPWLFALAASLAVLSKETAVVLLPVVWLYAWRRGRGLAAKGPLALSTWAALITPLVPLAAWALYYHHGTGYFTGNREYLSYNLYSTLSPARVFWSLLRRAYELFIGGFNWLLTACALVGFWWGRKHSKLDPARVAAGPPWRPFIFLTAGLVAIYLFLLSLVGGAILPRYLLPVLPLFYLVAAALVMRLPGFPARLILTAAAGCFVWAWFINPPYPFPFEDNLAYADFILLHEQAAHYLEAQPGQPRILTAWPATNELTEPYLGYVRRPLRVVPVQGFAREEFADVPPESFDLLYLYFRKWEPPGNWVTRFPGWLRVQGRYFDYRPQVAAQDLVARYHLRLLTELERRGQWVRIYSH
ncbi:MAG: glycosyltransferase family 39 protein [Terriglobia bacterium]|jgi:4-amino-4-deoxy-L-arabinose transferase-like glycosyltransferase